MFTVSIRPWLVMLLCSRPHIKQLKFLQPEGSEGPNPPPSPSVPASPLQPGPRSLPPAYSSCSANGLPASSGSCRSKTNVCWTPALSPTLPGSCLAFLIQAQPCPDAPQDRHSVWTEDARGTWSPAPPVPRMAPDCWLQDFLATAQFQGQSRGPGRSLDEVKLWLLLPDDFG